MSIPDLPKAELYAYLRTNKSDLISAKKDGIKFTESISCKPVVAVREVKTEATKEAGEDDSPVHKKDTIDVTVVCNTANFCDSHMDVLTSDSYSESIQAKGISIPHIADHKQSSTSHVGDVTAVYTKEIPLRELGLVQDGSTTALVMETTIRKDYNEDVFKFYQNGKINQHSIGLRYQEIKLALNSQEDDDKAEYAVWNELYPKIVNKELVDKRGYFWAVSKVDIIENSCVLFGANSLTPTLAIKSDIDIPNMGSNILTKKEGSKMTSITLEKYTELQDELAAVKESQALEVAKAVKAERNRATKIISSAKTFGIKSESVEKAVEKGWPLDMVADYFTDIAAEKDASTAIQTGAGDVGSADALQVKELADQQKETSFGGELEAGLKALGETEQLFGVMK